MTINEDDNKETAEKQQTEVAEVCSLSIPKIVAALHQKALAESDVGDFILSNSAIEGDAKSPKLKSAGEHIICITGKTGEEKIAKKDAIAKIQTYVQWFVGPDLASKVNDSVVLPLAEGGDTEKNDGQEEKPEEKDNEEPDENAESSDESEENEEDEVEESVHTSDFNLILENGNVKTFLQFLNEANDEDGDDGLETAGEGDDNLKVSNVNDDSDEDGVESEKTDDKNGESAIGYYIAYNLKVNGMKETKLSDAMKDFAKGAFDSLKITASGLFGGSGQSFTIGDVRKTLHNMKNIDTQKLASDVQNFIKKKYPKTGVEAYERDADTLAREIKAYSSQVNKDQKAAIQNSPFSICVKVQENDKAKPFLNRQKIADAIRKCISFFKFGSKMKVDKDSIIAIEDYIDKDEHSEADVARRPSYQKIFDVIRSEYENDENLVKKGETIDADLLKPAKGRALVQKIANLFDIVKKNSKARKQEEVLKSIDIFDKYNNDWQKKIKDIESFSYKNDFKKFLEEYEALEKTLKKESVDNDIIFRRIDSAKMLFEKFFDDKTFLSLIIESNDEDGDEGLETAGEGDDNLKVSNDNDDSDEDNTNDSDEQSNEDDDQHNSSDEPEDVKTDANPDTNLSTNDSNGHASSSSEKSSEAGNSSDESSSSESSSDNESNKKTTTLYIYPIQNSKKFDDGVNNSND